MSLLAQVNVLPKMRRTIVSFVVVGALLGLAFGLLKTRVYRSSATVPASRIGPELWSCRARPCGEPVRVKVPMTGNTWGPRFTSLSSGLEPARAIAIDSIAVSEGGGRPFAGGWIYSRSRRRRRMSAVDRAVLALGEIIKAREIKTLGAGRGGGHDPMGRVYHLQ